MSRGPLFFISHHGLIMRVAFQGEPGAFGEAAIAQVWGAQAIAMPVYAFEDVADAVARGRADAGVLPVENVIVGPVAASVAVLAARNDLVVVSETVVPVDLAVMAIPGVTLSGLTQVKSHPVALAQCAAWFRFHPAVAPVSVYDTAGAARMIAQDASAQAGAIASAAAAARYGLTILDRNVADRTDNATRFVVVVRRGV